MKEFTGSARTTVDAPPGEAFALITDPDRLPEWNAAVESVTDRPAELVPGAEWTVRMHPKRMPSWGSVSRVVEIDAERGRFRYETRNADGNPSSTTWTWGISP